MCQISAVPESRLLKIGIDIAEGNALLVDRVNQIRSEQVAENTEQFLKYIDEIVWNFGIHVQDSNCCHGMSYADIRALKEISFECDCSMQNIAQKLGFTKSGATRVVDRLERKGLVERRKSETDGRVCCVSPTAKGREALGEINGNAYARMNGIVEKIDEPMRQIILTALSSFLSATKK